MAEGHVDLGISAELEIVAQVPRAFHQKVAIDGAFLINGNIFLQRSFRNLGLERLHFHLRTRLDVDLRFYTPIGGVEPLGIDIHHGGETILAFILLVNLFHGFLGE